MSHNRSLVLMAVVSILAIAACSGGPAAPNTSGPLKVGIVSGNHQTDTAGSDRLPLPIVGQLVRLPSGQVAFLPKVGEKIGNFLLPAAAYADTAITIGTPIKNGVVCAKTLTDTLPLWPVVNCGNTDSNGKIAMVFAHGNKAGSPKAIIQGLVNGQVVTVDTAVATVTHASVFVFARWMHMENGLPVADTVSARDTLVHAGDTLNFNTYPIKARDRYVNLIPVTDYTFSYQRINTDPSLSDAAKIVNRLVPIRAGDTLIRVWADTVTGFPVHVKVQ